VIRSGVEIRLWQAPLQCGFYKRSSSPHGPPFLLSIRSRFLRSRCGCRLHPFSFFEQGPIAFRPGHGRIFLSLLKCWCPPSSNPAFFFSNRKRFRPDSPPVLLFEKLLFFPLVFPQVGSHAHGQTYFPFFSSGVKFGTLLHSLSGNIDAFPDR